jgi:hypothetical protein
MNSALTDLRYVWAAPYTMVGFAVGFVGCYTGGRMQRVGRSIEFYGGATTWVVAHLPLPMVSAITLGHVVLGRSAKALDRCRDHEWVHVEQYERWGPLFVPAYLGCSLVQWLRGRDPYRDNPFEREAYGRCP